MFYSGRVVAIFVLLLVSVGLWLPRNGLATGTATDACLCDCACGEIGLDCDVVDCFLDLEPVEGSPECLDPEIGACVCRGFSCDRADPSDGPCGQQCADVDLCGDCKCVGDCDADLRVEISELLTGVNIALGRRPTEACPSFDNNNNQVVDIADLVSAVGDALRGCNHLSPNEDVTIGGEIDFDSVDIPPGVTITLGDDTVIRSRGSVTIGGTVQGETLGDRGASVTIDSGGRIEIGGRVIAGDGPATTDSAGVDDVRVDDGGPGGDVTLLARSDVVVDSSALVRSGAGGDGGDANLLPGGAASMVARAGSGGRGGDIVIETDATLRMAPSSEPLFILGNGGDGGNTDVAVSDDGDASVAPIGSGGGRSGFPRFRVGAIEGLAYDEFRDVIIQGPVPESLQGDGGVTVWALTGESANLFDGGLGGDAGSVQIRTEPAQANASGSPGRISGSADACTPSRSVAGRDHVVVGQPGGSGLFMGGNGGDVTVRGGRGRGAGKGGDARATGGAGGNCSGVVPTNSIGLLSRSCTAGRGGHAAEARGGDGGEGGGSGGLGSATGGNGGSGPTISTDPAEVTFLFVGGAGGAAGAFGGAAGVTGDCCTPARPGRDGGVSGDATATGGAGGDGMVSGCGGHAGAATENSADGGRGRPGGFGFDAGVAAAQIGSQGGNRPDGMPCDLVADTIQGEAGMDGATCPAQVWKLEDTEQINPGRHEPFPGARDGTFHVCTVGESSASWRSVNFFNGEFLSDLQFFFEFTPPPDVIDAGARAVTTLALDVSGRYEEEPLSGQAAFSEVRETLSVNACPLNAGSTCDDRAMTSAETIAGYDFRGPTTDPESREVVTAVLTIPRAPNSCGIRWIYRYFPDG